MLHKQFYLFSFSPTLDDTFSPPQNSLCFLLSLLVKISWPICWESSDYSLSMPNLLLKLLCLHIQWVTIICRSSLDDFNLSPKELVECLPDYQSILESSKWTDLICHYLVVCSLVGLYSLRVCLFAILSTTLTTPKRTNSLLQIVNQVSLNE